MTPKFTKFRTATEIPPSSVVPEVAPSSVVPEVAAAEELEPPDDVEEEATKLELVLDDVPFAEVLEPVVPAAEVLELVVPFAEEVLDDVLPGVLEVVVPFMEVLEVVVARAEVLEVLDEVLEVVLAEEVEVHGCGGVGCQLGFKFAEVPLQTGVAAV